jgi:hypothetical protein
MWSFVFGKVGQSWKRYTSACALIGRCFMMVLLGRAILVYHRSEWTLIQRRVHKQRYLHCSEV